MNYYNKLRIDIKLEMMNLLLIRDVIFSYREKKLMKIKSNLSNRNRTRQPKKKAKQMSWGEINDFIFFFEKKIYKNGIKLF